MSNFAVYLRVSSKRQAEANSVTSQREEIKRWLEAKKIRDYTEYVDEAKTGTNTDRPGFQRLTMAIMGGKHTAVVVYSLSRLGRSVEHLAPWCAELRRRDVDLISIKEGIDAGTIMGRCFLNIVLALGEMDNELRKEACKDGIRAAIDGGKPWGAARPDHPLNKNYDWSMLNEYVRRRYSDRKIAELIGCSASAVRKRRNKQRLKK